jgi:hypothetical protein
MISLIGHDSQLQFTYYHRQLQSKIIMEIKYINDQLITIHYKNYINYKNDKKLVIMPKLKPEKMDKSIVRPRM